MDGKRSHYTGVATKYCITKIQLLDALDSNG
jgi:hypothetical protein